MGSSIVWHVEKDRLTHIDALSVFCAPPSPHSAWCVQYNPGAECVQLVGSGVSWCHQLASSQFRQCLLTSKAASGRWWGVPHGDRLH
jgi:hypothetical protein